MAHVVSAAWNFWYHIRIYITNTGTIPATGLVVTDTLPPGMIPWSVQVSPGGVFDGVDTVTWDLPALGPGNSTYVWIKAQTWSWAAGMSITNIACIDTIGIPEPVRVMDTSYVHRPPSPPPPTPTPTMAPMLMPTMAPTPTPSMAPTPTCTPTATPTQTFTPTRTNVMPMVDLYYVYLPVAEADDF
jgi:hypothetical protein